uniref:C2H2-type domain-containing protein n=2 Tax=Mesocestoides corti TaxID=53468 RepID=A0A5K3F2T4_MESCO
MMSSEDRETLYPLVINQLLHDGYGVFALSLKKILIPNCETVASNKLLNLVKLGLAVSKYLEDSELGKDFSQLAHAFHPNHYGNSSFFSNTSSNLQSVDQSPQQLQLNGSQSVHFPLGVNQPIKLEPGDHSFNSLHLPLGAYQRQWAQMANRSTINLDGEIHELPGDGSPNKLFECSLCGKVFNRRDKVKRHLSELHHGIKRHQCVTCSRLFSRNDKLVRHIMTVHQGIKAFGCLHCPRRFSRRWEYQRHMQTTHPTFNFAPPKALQNRLPLFPSTPAQTKSTTQQLSASQQVSPVTGVNNANTTVPSTSVTPTTQVSVASSPVQSTPTATTVVLTAAVTSVSPSSASSRAMFPVFPVFTSPSTTPWAANACSTSTVPATSAKPAPKPVAATTVSGGPTATASIEPPAVTDSVAPLSVPPPSTSQAMFPMFPVFTQSQTSSVPSCSSSNVPFTASVPSNNAVFPSTSVAFTPTVSYHAGYATMTTSTTNAPSQSNCDEPTSLTRMLL